MSSLPSLQTRLARAGAGAWNTAWKAHRLECITCTKATRHRRWDQACAEGAAIRAGRAGAQAALERELELDRQVIPGQLALFGEDECPA